MLVHHECADVRGRPDLIGIQSGHVASPEQAARNAQQGGQQLAAALSNPLVQAWIQRNPQVINDALGQRFTALDNEADKKWERVPWIRDAATAKREALKSGRPIFVELIVGRYGDEQNADMC